MIEGLRFPDASTVIAEEAARFRAASPADRMHAIRSVLAAGAVLIERSPRREFLEGYRARQEDMAWQAIREFVTRHGQRP